MSAFRDGLLLVLLLVCAGLVGAEERQTPLLGKTAKEWSAELESEDELRRVKGAWAQAHAPDASLKQVSDAAKHADSNVRVWAVRGLGFRLATATEKDAQDCESLLRKHLEDTSGSVRLAAAAALLTSKEHRAQAFTAIEKLLDDPSDAIRHHTLLAVDEPMELPPALLTKIGRLREDPYEYVKRVAERITGRQKKEQ